MSNRIAAKEKIYVGQAVLQVGSRVLYLKNPTGEWKIKRIYFDVDPPSLDIVQEDSGNTRNTTLENLFVGMPFWSSNYSITNKGSLRIGEIILGPGSLVFYNKDPERMWIIDKFNFGEVPPSVDIRPADASSHDNEAIRNTVLKNIQPCVDGNISNLISSAPSSLHQPPSYEEKNSIPSRCARKWPTLGGYPRVVE